MKTCLYKPTKGPWSRGIFLILSLSQNYISGENYSGQTPLTSTEMLNTSFSFPVPHNYNSQLSKSRDASGCQLLHHRYSTVPSILPSSSPLLKTLICPGKLGQRARQAPGLSCSDLGSVPSTTCAPLSPTQRDQLGQKFFNFQLPFSLIPKFTHYGTQPKSSPAGCEERRKVKLLGRLERLCDE